jgi:hypothetical protein
VSRALLIGAALVACKAPPPTAHVDAPGDCLALPGAARSSLVADPLGGGLYWFEPVPTHDFNGDLHGYETLVRYDFASRGVQIIADHVLLPLHVLGDKIIVLRFVEKSNTLVMVDRAHNTVQSLLPDYLAPVDVEPIDDHTLAVLANGDGPRAVYTIDLDRPRPHHLIDADVLISTWGGRVLVYVDQDLVSIEANGRKRTLPAPSDSGHPQGQDAYTVVDSTVHVHRMVGGDDRTIIADRRAWKLVNQPGSVLARTPPERGTSYAYLLASNTAKALPAVTGDTSIVGAAQLGAQTWALIGHNTVNYIGDLGDTSGETEVCLLPPSGTIAFKGRFFPKRYADKAELLHAAMPDAHGMQLLQDVDSPPMLYVDMTEAGGDDFAGMRARARTVQQKVTSLLGDREVMTEIHYADDRVGIMRWRRDRLRYRASAGMGDALITDATDFDLEVRDLVNRRGLKGKAPVVLCSGTFTNVTAKAIEHVAVRCVAGDRVNVISIPSIAPGATAHFDHTFETPDGQDAFFEVVSGREPLEVRLVENEARLLKVFQLAATVHDETQLTLERHKPAAPMTVQVSAPTKFADKTTEELTAVARTAFQRLLSIGQIYGLPPDPEFTLTIVIEQGKTYKFDGTELTPVE